MTDLQFALKDADQRTQWDMLGYDFDAIHRAVCPDPATLTRGQRENRVWPTAKDMLDFLGLLNDAEWHDQKAATTPITPAYYQALNNQLLGQPYKQWANGSAYVSHRLTAKGRAYLCWLKITHYTPPVKRCDLRCYERRFSTSTRWIAAVVDATRHAALNALAADHDASVQDHRAYMMGMG